MNDDDACVVCAGPLDEATSAVCDGCGGRFHLNKRNDVPGKDCGDVRINDLYQSLEYGCAVCRGEVPAAAPVHPLRRAPAVRPRRYRRRA